MIMQKKKILAWIVFLLFFLWAIFSLFSAYYNGVEYSKTEVYKGQNYTIELVSRIALLKEFENYNASHNSLYIEKGVFKETISNDVLLTIPPLISPNNKILSFLEQFHERLVFYDLEHMIRNIITLNFPVKNGKWLSDNIFFISNSSGIPAQFLVIDKNGNIITEEKDAMLSTVFANGENILYTKDFMTYSLYNVRSGTKKVLFKFDFPLEFRSFSPDEKNIIFQSSSYEKENVIYRYNIELKTLEPLLKVKKNNNVLIGDFYIKFFSDENGGVNLNAWWTTKEKIKINIDPEDIEKIYNSEIFDILLLP